jgi:hypothetical protein
MEKYGQSVCEVALMPLHKRIGDPKAMRRWQWLHGSWLVPLWIIVAAIFYYYLPVGVFIRPVGPVKFMHGGVVSADVVGRKIKRCPRVVGSERGYVIRRGGQGAEDAVKFEFYNDRTPNDSRPVGPNNFGTWRWYVDQCPAQVLMTMQHICDGEVRDLTIGPWPVDCGEGR